MINIDRKCIDPPIIKGVYRTKVVLEKLGIIFKNKCYLCETKKNAPEDFEIDHFVTLNEDDTNKFIWENLYLICDKCNKTRDKNMPVGGLLDPCNPDHDVENEIKYSFPFNKYDTPIFFPQNSNCSQNILNTIELLKKIHYGTLYSKILKSSLREVIKNEAVSLLCVLLELKKAIEDDNQGKISENEQILNDMISYDAPYTMLMRYLYYKYY